MSRRSEEWWGRARHARDQLVAQVISHPSVSMVDIGLDPQGTNSTPVLRVHIRQGDTSTLNIPSDVDGIPVRIIYGDYKLQSGSSAD